eukprot:357190-Chlamydomonas_euryale.AAC.2
MSEVSQIKVVFLAFSSRKLQPVAVLAVVVAPHRPVALACSTGGMPGEQPDSTMSQKWKGFGKVLGQ